MNLRFVINAIEKNPAINYGIIGTAIYGVVLIISRLLSAQSDFRVIERFGKEALSGVSMNKLLEEPWLKNKYVRHYLAHIAQTGGTISSQLDQHAIESELHALNNEYESRLELPQFIVGFMIAMGLLGTFIGLLKTLTGISGLLEIMNANAGGDVSAQFSELLHGLKEPLGGMGIAFSASMFGLVASLMLAVMMTNLRRYVNRVIAVARNVMHDLIELSRPTVSAPVYRENNGAVGVDFAGSNSILASRIDLLIKKMELLMESFEVSVSGTQKLNDLLGFGPRMKEISERTLEEIRNLSGAYNEQHRLSQKLIDTNTDISKTLVNVFEVQRQTKENGEKSLESLKTIISGQSEHSKLSQKLIEVCGDVARLASVNLDIQRQSKDINEKNIDGLRSISSEQLEQTRLLEKLIDLNADILRMSENTLELNQHQETTNESALSEIKSLVSLESEQRQIGQSIVDGIEYSSRVADNSLESQKRVSSDILAALRNLDERIAKLEEVEVGGTRHLWAIKEILSKLSQSLGVVELVSMGVSQQTLLLEALVVEVKNSQSSLYSIQQSLRGNSV